MREVTLERVSHFESRLRITYTMRHRIASQVTSGFARLGMDVMFCIQHMLREQHQGDDDEGS